MSRLRSRLSVTSVNSYVSNVFVEGARFSRPIKEQTSGSLEVPKVIEDQPVKDIKDEPKNETLGKVIGLPIGEEGQVPEVEGPGEQEISIIPNKEVSGSLVEGSEVLGSKAGKQPKGE